MVVSGISQWLPQVKLYSTGDTAYLLSLSYQQKSHYCCHVFRIDYDELLFHERDPGTVEWTVNGPRESILEYEIDSVEVTPIEDSRFARLPAPATRSDRVHEGHELDEGHEAATGHDPSSRILVTFGPCGQTPSRAQLAALGTTIIPPRM